MTRDRFESAAAIALRVLFALLLAVTGVAKLLDMPGFYDVVASYRSLPLAMVPMAAWSLAVGEIVLAAWLVWGRELRWSSLLVVLLHAMYFGWLVVALARGLQLDNCGCFGVYWARPLTWYSPLEDLALLALAIGLWRLSLRRKQ